MGVIKSKMGTIGSKIGRNFEQKRQAKWLKKMQIWSRPMVHSTGGTNESVGKA